MEGDLAPTDLPRATDVSSIATGPTNNGPPSTDDDDLAQHEAFLADRALVQTFATKVIEAYSAETVAVVFLPWTQGNVPAGVLCPPSNTALLNAAQLQEAIRGKSAVVCPCTFKYPAEESAAARIVEQLLALPDVCILAAHLLTPDIQLTSDWSEHVNNILQRIIATHVDDVMLDPDTDPTALRLRIRLAKHTWETNRQNLQAIMQQEPQAPTVEEMNSLEAAHQQLLWEDIPRELMPHFHVMDPHLIETDDAVGDYTLVKKRVTTCGALWEGRDKHGATVALKCIDKKNVFTPGEVEGINREYRFLQDFVRHPNIVRALDFLHSQTYVYIIMEYVGDQNLQEYLSGLSGNRLEADMALSIFWKVVSAMAHCHQKEITHRSVALEHVVLAKAESEDQWIPRLVDFHSAMVAKPGVVSRSICGKLPCIAPEILSGEAYVPILADVWSLGVLLLEIAGGLGSLLKAVDMTQAEADSVHTSEETQQASANKVRDYFIVAGNHENALAHVGGVRNEEILNLLMRLLVLPTDRPSLLNLSLVPGQAQTNADEVVVIDVVDGVN